MEDKKEALRVNGIMECSECEKLNKAMDVMEVLGWYGTHGHTALAFDKETMTILIDEETLMRAIQIVNPRQRHRKLKLITREEFKEKKNESMKCEYKERVEDTVRCSEDTPKLRG